MLAALLLLSAIASAQADERFWRLEGSSGYGFDPGRAVFDDKSKPQNFMLTHTALRLTERNAYLNFQSLGEKEFACSPVHDDVIQCVGALRFFVFDKKLHRFNLAELGGYVADDHRSNGYAWP